MSQVVVYTQMHYIFPVQHIHTYVIQFCEQSDCESEKLKRKIDFSESLTVLGHTNFTQSSVAYQYLY